MQRRQSLGVASWGVVGSRGPRSCGTQLEAGGPHARGSPPGLTRDPKASFCWFTDTAKEEAELILARRRWWRGECLRGSGYIIFVVKKNRGSDTSCDLSKATQLMRS